MLAKPFTAADLVQTIGSCKASQPPKRCIGCRLPFDNPGHFHCKDCLGEGTVKPTSKVHMPQWFRVGSRVRKQEKWDVFSKFSKYIAGIVIASLICLVLPLWLANEALGKALLISIPPMLLVSLSWMAGMWKFFDDDHNILLIATVGMIPVRMAVVVAFTLALTWYSNVLIGAFVIGMIIHWALFAVPEMLMMHRFGKQFTT